jgi:hypothetical protein
MKKTDYVTCRISEKTLLGPIHIIKIENVKGKNTHKAIAKAIKERIEKTEEKDFLMLNIDIQFNT